MKLVYQHLKDEYHLEFRSIPFDEDHRMRAFHYGDLENGIKDKLDKIEKILTRIYEEAEKLGIAESIYTEIPTTPSTSLTMPILTPSPELTETPIKITGAFSGLSEYENYVTVSDGSLWGWGSIEDSGHLADTPVKITDNVRLVNANIETFIIKNDNSLWQLDRGELKKVTDGVKAVSSTDMGQFFVLQEDGSLSVWDRKNNSEVIMDGVADVASGGYHVLALKEDGSVWTWKHDNNYAKKVLDDVTYIAAGWDSSYALKADGSMWAWGGNYFGQLTDVPTGYVCDEPIQVMDGVKTVAAGYSFGMALKQDGSVWTWGEGYYGQLGNGSKYEKDPVPTKVIDGVVSIAAGMRTSFALKEDGSLWAWGCTLLDDFNTSELSPVKVLNGFMFK